ANLQRVYVSITQDGMAAAEFFTERTVEVKPEPRRAAKRKAEPAQPAEAPDAPTEEPFPTDEYSDQLPGDGGAAWPSPTTPSSPRCAPSTTSSTPSSRCPPWTSTSSRTATSSRRSTSAPSGPTATASTAATVARTAGISTP